MSAVALSSGFLGYLNIMSGSAFAQATLFALSVSPYITASIVIQLLTIAIPALERWSKDGEEGRKKISALTRFVTVALALVTSYGYMNIISSPSVGILAAEGFFQKAVVVACYCAGASLIMWLAEKINEFGIGNGISIILFANILSGGWNIIVGIWSMIVSDSYHLAVGIILGVVSIAITLAFVVLVVLVTNSEKLAKEVSDEIDRQLSYLERTEIAGKSIDSFGAAIVCENMDDAFNMANEIAPEHLEILTKDAFGDLDKVRNAGSIFVGENSPEPLGDYFAGTNHVLPTNGTARFASPLSVDTFIKKSGVICYTRRGLESYKDDIIRFADSEGRTAHANSVKVRFEQ
jgi:hypothetical protein